MPTSLVQSTVPSSALSKEDFVARAGVDTSRISGTPGSFLVGPESGIVSDTSQHQADTNALGNDITKGLSQYGINPPDTGLNSELDKMNAEISNRETQLAGRKTEDLASIESSYSNAEKQLGLSQEEQLANAEGRTRIGGFFTQLEAKDILNLKRQNALDMAALQGKHQQALTDAKRAYEDQNYQLAKDKMAEAKDIEQTMYNRKNDYFNNVLKYNQMTTPVMQAAKDVQDYALNAMAKYPSAFTDLKPDDLTKITLADINKRIINSPEYKQELYGKTGNDQQTIINNFNKAISDPTPMLEKGLTREQFIRQLQAQFPDIDAKDIARKVYETYPDNWQG